MKIITLIIAGLAAAGGIAADFVMPDVELKVSVTNEGRTPIAGATVGASFPHIYGAGASYQGEEKEEKTDKEGIAVLKAKTAAPVGGMVRMDGYYASHFDEVDFIQMLRENRPLKAEREVVLKQIVNPIPMFAYRFNVKVPNNETPLGYDLEVADWVAPYGKGKTTDLIFNLSGYYHDASDHGSVLTITFPNKGDGMKPFQAAKFIGSDLRSEHQAPMEGYLGKWTLNKSRKPGQMSKDWVNETRTDRNYYIRVRTKVDEKGKVISALYGKIYGDFEFGIGDKGSFLKAESVYLNPTPNDRNVEFDVKRNLLTNIKTRQPAFP